MNLSFLLSPVLLAGAYVFLQRFPATISTRVGTTGLLLWLLADVMGLLGVHVPHGQIVFPTLYGYGFLLFLFGLGRLPITCQPSQIFEMNNPPKAVVRIGNMMVLLAILALVLTLIPLSKIPADRDVPGGLYWLGLLALLQLCFGVGIRNGRNWARWSYLLTTPLGLLLSLYTQSINEGSLVTLAFFAFAVVYLTNASADHYFDGAVHHSEKLETPV